MLSPPQRPLSFCCAALSVKVAEGLGRGKMADHYSKISHREPLRKREVYTYSCGRWKTNVFEYNDDKVRVHCTRPQRTRHGGDQPNVPLLFGRISSFVTLPQLQVAYINLQADYARRRLVIILSTSSSELTNESVFPFPFDLLVF